MEAGGYHRAIQSISPNFCQQHPGYVCRVSSKEATHLSMLCLSAAQILRSDERTPSSVHVGAAELGIHKYIKPHQWTSRNPCIYNLEQSFAAYSFVRLLQSRKTLWGHALCFPVLSKVSKHSARIRVLYPIAQCGSTLPVLLQPHTSTAIIMYPTFPTTEPQIRQNQIPFGS